MYTEELLSPSDVSSHHLQIHGLVNLAFAQGFPWESDILANLLGDIPSLPACATHQDPITIRVELVRELSTSRMREIEDGIFGDKNGVLDLRYRVLVQFPNPRQILLRTDNPALEWTNWSIFLALLMANVSLVHGAAVEKNGVATIFPSWGGVGKTALVTEAIQQHGFKLLGDDLVILGGDGSCYGFPKPMVLYPYHRDLFPNVFQAGRGPIAPTVMNGWLSKAAIAVKPALRAVPGLLRYARRHNPQSVRISPSEVFGKDNLASTAQLGNVVWLDRIVGLDTPKMTRSDGSLMSRIMGSTISQYDPWCRGVMDIAMGLGFLECDQYQGSWMRALSGGLAGRPQHILHLPADLSITEVPGVIHRELVSHGVWKD